MDDLDATGIRVMLTDLKYTDRLGPGSPVWTIPLGGGRVQADGILVEVEPVVEMPKGRWRDHGELDRLAAISERNGGFIRSGDAIHVGDEILVGRDAMEFVIHLNRRANQRIQDPHHADYDLGWRDAMAELKSTLGSVTDKSSGHRRT